MSSSKLRASTSPNKRASYIGVARETALRSIAEITRDEEEEKEGKKEVSQQEERKSNKTEPIPIAENVRVEPRDEFGSPEEVLEDFEFLENLQKLLDQREEEKRNTLDQFHLRVQQQQRRSAERKAKKNSGGHDPKIVIGKFGML